MMMLLRKKMAIVLWIAIISFTLFIFLQWGLDISRSMSKGSEKSQYVASVNGQKIPIAVYRQLLNQYRSNYRGKLTRDVLYDIEEQTYSDLVNGIIFDEIYKERKIKVYPKEVIEIIKNVPPQEIKQDTSFYTNGQFDYMKYRQVIANPQNAYWLAGYKERIEKELPKQKLFMELSSAVHITNDQIQREYLMYYDSVDVEYLYLNKFAIPKEEISESKAMEYYETHNYEFYRPDRAIIEYYIFSIAPSPQDEMNAREEAKNVYEEILNGGDFATIAQDVSDDTLTAQNGGETGFFSTSPYGQEFDKVLKTLKKNEVSKPFKTEEGWHIVKLLDRNGRLTNVAHILIKPEVSYTTVEEIRRKAESAREKLLKSKDWSAIKSDIPGEYGKTKEFDYRRGYISGIGPALRIARFATQARIGEISGIIEEKGMLAIVKVDAKKKAGIPPYEDIKAEVMSAAADYMLQKAAKDSLNKLYSKIKNTKYWKSLDGKNGLVYYRTGKISYITPVNGVPQFSEFYGAAFSTGVNKVSHPVVTTSGAYIIRVLSHKQITADEMKSNMKEIAMALKDREQTMVRNDWMNKIIRRFKIIDYRLQ